VEGIVSTEFQLTCGLCITIFIQVGNPAKEALTDQQGTQTATLFPKLLRLACRFLLALAEQPWRKIKGKCTRKSCVLYVAGGGL
jgi:hypothetical protein